MAAMGQVERALSVERELSSERAPQRLIHQIFEHQVRQTPHATALLHGGRIGRLDNCFALGGHSLLVVQMMERLRRQGLAIDVRSVFERPTLADLAGAITAAGRFLVPPNAIPDQCSAITPAMLPLVQLTENDIERIVADSSGRRGQRAGHLSFGAAAKRACCSITC